MEGYFCQFYFAKIGIAPPFNICASPLFSSYCVCFIYEVLLEIFLET